jgi:type IV fimbrial biogenesis protein FimT
MRSRSAGFSLLELMLVIGILAVMASLAIPGFGYLSANTKVKSASTELYLAMIRARSEAVKRNRAVSITADGSGWQGGWQIVVDGNNDGDYVDADDDRVVCSRAPSGASR